MIVRKTLLAMSALALMSTPAWALPSNASSDPGKHAPSSAPAGPPSTTPNNTDNPGAANRHSQGDGGDSHPNKPSHPAHPNHPGHPGHPSRPVKPRKCVPHDMAYIVSGTLVSQTLIKNPDGTYNGNVTITVTHTNRHAAGDEGMTETYALTDARVTFGLADINHDGSVGLDDLQTGARAKAIGKTTTLAKRCNQNGFTATTTIRKVIFHKP